MNAKATLSSPEAEVQMGAAWLERIQYATASGLPALSDILVATDFTPASEKALEHAVRLAQAAKGRLLLVHVMECGTLPQAQSVSGFNLPSAAPLHKSIDETMDWIRDEGVPVDSIVRVGLAAETILELIAERKVDLVIVGTHGFSGFERMVFGSTAEAVFRRAPCPVVTVGPRVRIPRAGVRLPVIFATDFHRPCIAAIRHAAALAVTMSAPLHCVHVLPLPIEAEDHAHIVAQIMIEALHHLASDLPMLEEAPVCALAYGSDISHAVVEYAKAHDASCIVLGVRRTTRIPAHLPPQVTYRIVVTSPCPVATVSFDRG